MEMMLEIIYKFLSKNKKATFNQIFSQVQSILKVRWKKMFPNNTILQIETRKKGELFGYLNTDGRFIKIDNNYWALTHNYSYNDIKKFRANIGENND